MKTKTALDQPSINLVETTPYLDLEVKKDTDNQMRLMGKAVIVIDPATGKTWSDSTPLHMQLADKTNVTDLARITVASDGYFATGDVAFLQTASVQMLNNFGVGLASQRTPNTFKNAAPAAAPATTDLWAPAGGKKFRLMGGVITMSGSIAAAALRTLQLIEETAGTIIVQANLLIPVTGGSVSVPFSINGNGFLASTVNKKLQIVTAGGTYVAGTDAVSVWGTEE